MTLYFTPEQQDVLNALLRQTQNAGLTPAHVQAWLQAHDRFEAYLDVVREGREDATLDFAGWLDASHFMASVDPLDALREAQVAECDALRAMGHLS